MPNPRAYSAAHFGLELDGTNKSVGFIKSIEGGGVTSEVITYQMGDNYAIWRQLGRPKYEDIKIQTGMTTSVEFMDWITDFFNGSGARRSGAIVAADFSFCEQARREFADALITEFTFPKLDGTDKTAAYATVTLSPEKMTYLPGSGQQVQGDLGDWQGQQLWTACNFDFTIDGFDSNLIRVTKVDSFTVKQKAIDYQMGDQPAIKVPSRIEYPTITFYVPEVDAAALIEDYMQYAEHFNEVDTGYTGHIQCMDNTPAKNVLFSIDLSGCKIKSYAPEKHDASAEEIKLVKFEMAIEGMTFNGYSSGGGGGAGLSVDVSVSGGINVSVNVGF